MLSPDPAAAGSALPLVHLNEPNFSGNFCRSTLVTQAPRADVFAVRAKFEGCGERPRFRVRLRFDEACEQRSAASGPWAR